MSEPKASAQRYSVRYYTCEKDDDGKYVLYSDYAAVERERDELRAANAALEAKCAELVAARLDAIKKAFISGAESVNERVSYDYAFQRWMTSDTRADALSAALARAGKEGA